MKVSASKPYVSSCTESNHVLIKSQYDAMSDAEMKIRRETEARVVSAVTLIDMDGTQANGGEDIDDLMGRLPFDKTFVCG